MRHCRNAALAALSALALGVGCQPQPASDEVSVEYGALATTKSALVNLLGYAPGAQKIAVVVSSNAAAGKVEVLNSGGAVVWPPSGTQNTVFKGTDNNSGDAVHHADFTAFQTVGTGYKLRVTIPAAGGTVYDSESFDIGTDLLGAAALPKSAMKYYYYHRQGMALASARLDQGGSTAFAHSGLHLDDNTLTGYPNAGLPWSTTTFNVVGGWSDAGDFGKYADNQAMAAWLLMNLFERYKGTPLGTTGYGLNIDESGNTVPDLLDEIAWGSKYMRGMLPNPTTRVSSATVNDLAAHKCHNTTWSAYPSTAATESSNYCNGASCGGDDNNRYCMGSSTTATYGVARNLAQLARLLDPPGSVGYDDAATATDYYNVAKEAYGRAGGIYPGGSQTAAPLKLFNKNDTTQSPGGDTGGGPYDDADADDDKYDAAVELYLTACARGDTTAVTAYKAHVTANAYYKRVAFFDWGTELSLGDAMGDDAAVGTLSLLAAHDTYCTGANALPSADLTTMRDNLKAYADTLAGNIIGQNYPSAIGNSATVYPWGSNKAQAYGGLVLVLAYEKVTPQDKRYLRAAFRLLDYLYGVNPVRQSFVTGFPVESGTCCFETDTHNRLGANGTTWPKGWLAGGPMNVAHTDTSTPQTGPIMKRYAANGTNATAWASKEDTIDWNGGLASLAYALDFYETALPADAGPNCSDGMKNGTEVDVDCRGSCTAKCFNGQACTTAADCIGNSCVGNVCAPPPPPQNPFGGTARPVPGTIQIEDYDTGGQNVAYNDSDSTNQGGAYRTDGVDIESTTDTGGGFNIGYVAAGEWLEYTVSVASTASYSLTVRVATPNSGKSLHVESDGTNVSGSIAVPNTGGWQTWQTVTVPTVSLTAGTHVLRLAFDTDLINANWLAFAGGGGPSCFDGIKNGTETDIDCGGSCAADCADGKLCSVGADCTGGNCVSGTCCTVLGAPTGLSATPGNAQVSLSWTAVAGAESTNIKRSTTSGSGYATVGSSTTTSHVDPGLTNGTTYFYVTTAVNTCGAVSTESANSSEVSAMPSASGGCTPQTPNCEFQMSGGVASVEGEHWFVNSTTGVTTGDSWSQAAAAPASGGQCMVVGPDNGNSWTTNVTTTSPRLDFKVNFTAGTFFLHIRGDGSDGANDSCWGGRAGVLLTTVYDYPETVNSWAWRSVSLGSVTAGIHTINVWGREDGFRLDKLVINTSSTAPTGAGPAESALN